MIVRIRDFCRDESLGIVLPIGFAVGLGLLFLFAAVGRDLVVPIVDKAVGGDGTSFGLDTNVAEITFGWSSIVADSIALLLLAALVYYVFVRPIPEDVELEEDMRECPECLSSVLAEARRCAFCTSPLPPIETARSPREA